jgi:hypothetical protein
MRFRKAAEIESGFLILVFLKKRNIKIGDEIINIGKTNYNYWIYQYIFYKKEFYGFMQTPVVHWQKIIKSVLPGRLN